MHLKDDFSAGRAITQVPASWFNQVAKFLNNLCPNFGIEFDKHDDGSPTAIGIDTDETASDCFRSTNATDINTTSIVPTNTYYQLDPNGWKRGDDTDGIEREINHYDPGQPVTPVQGGNFAGIKIQVVTRIVRNSDKDLFYWRYATFDKAGRLYELSAEQGVLGEVNYANY